MTWGYRPAGRCPLLTSTTIGHTLVLMPTAKIAISIDPDDLEELDALVRRGVGASRSGLIRDAVREKLQRLKHVRLAQECAKLDPVAERAEAEVWSSGEAEWPEY